MLSNITIKTYEELKREAEKKAEGKRNCHESAIQSRRLKD